MYLRQNLKQPTMTERKRNKHKTHKNPTDNRHERTSTEINNHQRYRLSNDEEALVIKYREKKGLMEKEAMQAGIAPEDVRHFWYKSEMFSIFAKPKQKGINDLKNEIIKEMDKHSPKYKPIIRKKIKEGHLLVIDPADVHLGKLSSAFETGEIYGIKIAVDRVLEGVRSLIDAASHYPIDKVLLVIGNDILHTDNAFRTTTAGTPQDTDGMWYDNFLIAKKLYVDIIEMLILVADVHVVYNPSNHDFTNGFFLAETVKSWFRTSKNITWDCDMRHRKYFKYGLNLLGFTHGDGAKNNDLPLLMAQEAKGWNETKHRYIYTHHIHHKQAKEIIGVTVESMRSTSAADGWHSRNGYQHAAQGIEAFIHHPKNGQVAKFNHIFQ